MQKKYYPLYSLLTKRQRADVLKSAYWKMLARSRFDGMTRKERYAEMGKTRYTIVPAPLGIEPNTSNKPYCKQYVPEEGFQFDDFLINCLVKRESTLL